MSLKSFGISLSLHAALILLLLLPGAGFLVGRYTDFLRPEVVEWVESDTTSLRVDIKDIGDIDPDFTMQPDTVWETRWKTTPPNIDSLQAEAMAYWENIYGDSIKDLRNISFIANVDSTFGDSLVSFDVSFVSPIPLHWLSYFRFNNLSVKENTITTTHHKQEEVYYYDRLSFGVGIRNEFINQQLKAQFIGDVIYKPINTRFFELDLIGTIKYLDKIEGEGSVMARMKLF